jgi:hypothetical protein
MDTLLPDAQNSHSTHGAYNEAHNTFRIKIITDESYGIPFTAQAVP